MILNVRKVIVRNISRFKHTDNSENGKVYSKTILLPQTKLPLRLNNVKLKERDDFLKSHAAISQLYSSQSTHRKTEFVLHDGPPYANGDLHMGHAVNKIMKDTIVRYNLLKGNKVNYVPGWDCHGLPIELKAITDTSAKLSQIDIRSKARNFAQETINKQKDNFKSWGVIGDWKNAYTTFSNSYVKNELKTFYKLYEKKLIYRDVKPVYWSPSSRTALAEAELEYNSKHKSRAVYAKLKIENIPKIPQLSKDNLYALIWTTTPWTLPSNEAICFNPKISYSIVQKPESEDTFIVATNLIENLSQILGYQLVPLLTFPGETLDGATYFSLQHSNKYLPFLPASHATESKGTGLVHTAPAHGLEDYVVALQHKLPLVNMVDESGCFTSEAGENLEGLFVLSNGTEAVLKMLNNKIVHNEVYVHSYPYDWRTNQPVILRSSKQWFIDTDAIKTRAIELLGSVEIYPKTRGEIYKSNLINQLIRRPSWCISRQRTWGVPIPAFYDVSEDKPIIEKSVVDHLCNLIDKYGPDCWWNLKLEELLPANFSNTSLESIVKGNDIFDIWFDSGLSWLNVLHGDQVADLYLEGVDQFTGWFQTSLITSVALRDKTPYKSVYVHGYVVDENGLKMSKSLGNVVNPLDIIEGKNGSKAYGIDTLRWWVVCHANSEAMAPISKTVLQASADEVHKIRSVLRFALGAVYDFKEDVNYNELLILDKYILHLLLDLHTKISNIYESYEFNNKLSSHLINFLTGPISALYYVIIKDRLYCNAANDLQRRASQFVLLELLKNVTLCFSPILPHLAEEIYQHLSQKQEGSFFTNASLSKSENWFNSKVANVVEDLLLPIKKDINKKVGNQTLYLDVEIQVSQETLNSITEIQDDLQKFNDELIDILQVSKVSIVKNDNLGSVKYELSIRNSDLYMCERCRRVFATVKNELCNRCDIIVNSLQHKTTVANYFDVLFGFSPTPGRSRRLFHSFSFKISNYFIDKPAKLIF